jgi:hypothetical protein
MSPRGVTPPREDDRFEEGEQADNATSTAQRHSGAIRIIGSGMLIHVTAFGRA